MIIEDREPNRLDSRDDLSRCGQRLQEDGISSMTIEDHEPNRLDSCDEYSRVANASRRMDYVHDFVFLMSRIDWTCVMR